MAPRPQRSPSARSIGSSGCVRCGRFLRATMPQAQGVAKARSASTGRAAARTSRPRSSRSFAPASATTARSARARRLRWCGSPGRCAIACDRTGRRDRAKLPRRQRVGRRARERGARARRASARATTGDERAVFERLEPPAVVGEADRIACAMLLSTTAGEPIDQRITPPRGSRSAGRRRPRARAGSRGGSRRGLRGPDRAGRDFRAEDRSRDRRRRSNRQ